MVLSCAHERQHGRGGNGGGHGGWSIALVNIDGDVTASDNVTLFTDAAGDGGIGKDGQNGGSGGGIGLNGDFPMSSACAGGSGGKGGDGGPGAGGNGGSSIGYVHTLSAVASFPVNVTEFDWDMQTASPGMGGASTGNTGTIGIAQRTLELPAES